jgi:histidyl-tRNA synthetase
LGNPLERAEYNKILNDYYNSSEIYGKLSDLSKLRIEKKNPLRIFDSKEKIDVEISQNAPSLFSVLGEDSKSNFEKILKSLNQLGTCFVFITIKINKYKEIFRF